MSHLAQSLNDEIEVDTLLPKEKSRKPKASRLHHSFWPRIGLLASLVVVFFVITYMPTSQVLENGEVDNKSDIRYTADDDQVITQEYLDQLDDEMIAELMPDEDDSLPPWEKKAKGMKIHPHVLATSYTPRGKPLTEAERQALAEQWGSWTLVDPKANQRPAEDFFAEYPFRDIPWSKFPESAWQTDQEYLSKFLPEAQALVKRAMEAILAEYGHGPLDEPDKTFAERADMFDITMTDLPDSKEANGVNKGGQLPSKSFAGLVRRVLHSIVTEDTFVFVMGGHSAAAGHGNHFQQSYTLQFQKVMEPVFARLGVQCTARNIGMGGLGTSQNALAAGDLYGHDMDILMWDSGMTEREPRVVDLFFRQGLIGGAKVPLIMGANGVPLGFLQTLYNESAADVGVPGNGMFAIPQTESTEQVETLPWAARYLKCAQEMAQVCRSSGARYIGNCWVEREDVPPQNWSFKGEPSGRASWHPGNRVHQLSGRVLAFIVLRALEKALSIWSEAANYALPDDAWHMADYYANIRDKVMESPKYAACDDCGLPARVYTVPMQGRSEFTPRAKPVETSIRSILKPGATIPKPAANFYDPPDVRIPWLDVPDGEVDYLAIVENGVDFGTLRARLRPLYEEPEEGPSQLANPAMITHGQGFALSTVAAPDNCDGSYNSFCNRGNGCDCPLYGHNDDRGGIVMDGLSGWLVMNLKNVTHGLIIVKIEDWHLSGSNWRTEGWISVNNEPENHRQLGGVEIPYCDDFHFEFAIDGQITSWDKDEWLSRMNKLQRVAQFWTLLDEEDYIAKEDTELALRMTGCQRIKTFFLTHVYWA